MYTKCFERSNMRPDQGKSKDSLMDCHVELIQQSSCNALRKYLIAYAGRLGILFRMVQNFEH